MYRTCLVFVLTILSLSSFSQNFLYKTSPIISSSESNFKELPIFNLNGDEFNMSFYFLANKVGFLMDASLFTIQAFLSKTYLKEDDTLTRDEFKLELENCKDHHFPNDVNLRKSFISLGIDKSLCFKKQQNIQPRLVGMWGQELFETIYIKYQRCVNGTSRFFKKQNYYFLKFTFFFEI